MDPVLVELGRSCDESRGAISELEMEGRSERNQYLYSGLYSSFTISSLQHSSQSHQSVKMEPRSDHHDNNSSVIRFRTSCGHSSLPLTPSPVLTETSNSARPSPEQAHSSPCPSSPPESPTHTTWKGRGQSRETNELEQTAQPLNLSSCQRDRGWKQNTSTPERRGLADSSPLRSRKPKGLEISASSLLLTGNDLVSIALNSPALPSGSLTPAFLTAQV